MKTALALTLGLALCLPAIADANPCPCGNRCPCAKDKRINFGVDWDKLDKNPAGGSLHPRLLDFVEKWIELPDRILDVTWYALTVGSCGGLVLAGLVVANAIGGGRRA